MGRVHILRFDLHTKGPSTLFYFPASPKPRKFPLQSYGFLISFVEKIALVSEIILSILTLPACVMTLGQAPGTKTTPVFL